MYVSIGLTATAPTFTSTCDAGGSAWARRRIWIVDSAGRWLRCRRLSCSLTPRYLRTTIVGFACASVSAASIPSSRAKRRSARCRYRGGRKRGCSGGRGNRRWGLRCRACCQIVCCSGLETAQVSLLVVGASGTWAMLPYQAGRRGRCGSSWVNFHRAAAGRIGPASASGAKGIQADAFQELDRCRNGQIRRRDCACRSRRTRRTRNRSLPAAVGPSSERGGRMRACCRGATYRKPEPNGALSHLWQLAA